MPILEARKRIETARIQNLKELDLSLSELKTEDLAELMPEIAALNISKLKLGQNPFTAIEFIGDFSNITELDLYDTKIIAFPDSIDKLSNLTSLGISGAGLKELPASIGRLSKLTSLNLSGVNLVTLPESMGGLKNLTDLTLWGGSLVDLPDSLGKLSRLTDLTITSDSLKTLPGSLGNLKTLTHLRLYTHELTVLPESIGKLSNLAELTIWSEILVALPESIGELSSLGKLTVNAESLVVLPESIGKLSKLTQLNVTSDSLRTLPDSIDGLLELTDLTVKGKIETLPNSIGKLRKLTDLTLEGCPILTLPDSIGEMSSLFSMDVSKTLITTLPDSLRKLEHLQELSLYNTPLAPETRNWLDLHFAGRAHYNMAAFERDVDFDDVLLALYAQEDEWESVTDRLEACDLDPTTVIYGDDHIEKPAKEIIEEFLKGVPIDTVYELELYGPPLRSIVDGVLNEERFSREERGDNLAKMAIYLGDCSTPIREALEFEAVKQLLTQERPLSEMNQKIIERQAVRSKVSRLDGFAQNEKIEQLNGLINALYLEGAEVNDDNPVRIIGERERLPSTTDNIEFAFEQIKNRPELVQNFVSLVCQTDGNNQPVMIDDCYLLDSKKIQDIKEDYIVELGFGTPEQMEKKSLLDKFPYEMQDLLQKHEELYGEYFSDAGHLLDIPSQVKELKGLLAKDGIAVKDEYEKFFSQKKSEIQTFLDNKKNPKVSMGGFVTPLNESERRRSGSPDRDRSGEKQVKEIRPTPRM